MLEQTSTLVTIACGILAVMAGLVGWLRWVRPRLRHGVTRVGAALDTLAGRPPIVDNITGKELAPELPSIGKRMESVEGSVAQLVEVIKSQHQQDIRLNAHEQALDLHEGRIKQLEDGTIERIAAKAESVSAWRAVEAVAKSSPPDEPELD